MLKYFTDGKFLWTRDLITVLSELTKGLAASAGGEIVLSWYEY